MCFFFWPNRPKEVYFIEVWQLNLRTGPYPEADAGRGEGYSLFQAATPFWGVFNSQNIYFSLAPRGVTDTPLDTAL